MRLPKMENSPRHSTQFWDINPPNFRGSYAPAGSRLPQLSLEFRSEVVMDVDISDGHGGAAAQGRSG